MSNGATMSYYNVKTAHIQYWRKALNRVTCTVYLHC